MEPFLLLEHVTVDFNGFKALNDLTFSLEQGELRFVIGPNGAGKTTLIDVISGKVRPSSGKVRFAGGANLAAMVEHRIVKAGIGRKFQTPALFRSLTVYQHLELAMGLHGSGFALLRRPGRHKEERIRRTLAQLRMEDVAQTPAGTLSHGRRQWLEIGMLLIQEPRLLLLDEPVAGMTSRERVETGRLLEALAADRSVLVVEHDMDFVRQFSTRVSVMHEGRLLREGSMQELQKDQQVIDSYLGRSHLVRGPGSLVRSAGPVTQWQRTDG